MQCQTCGAAATGRSDGRFFLGINLPHRFRGGKPQHRDCGGRLLAFDTNEVVR